MKGSSIEIVVAATPKGEIGYLQTIPWKLSGDLQRFKELTMGHIVIMGRVTYETLPNTFDGRILIVVSSTKVDRRIQRLSPVHFVSSLTEALALSIIMSYTGPLFIIGGARLYEEGLKIAHAVHLTTVYKGRDIQYDTKINNFNLSQFECVTDPVAIFELNKETNVMQVSHSYSFYKRKT